MISNYELQTKLRKSSTALICAILGIHYLYLGKIGTFILFFITGGGFGIWWFIDLFRVSSLVSKFNGPIISKMEMNDLKNEMSRR